MFFFFFFIAPGIALCLENIHMTPCWLTDILHTTELTGHEEWLKSLFCSWADKQEWEYSFRLTNCIAHLRYFLQFSYWSRRSVFKTLLWQQFLFGRGKQCIIYAREEVRRVFQTSPLSTLPRAPDLSALFLLRTVSGKYNLLRVTHGLWKILSIQALCHRKQHLTDITFSTKWICSS